MTSPGEPKIKLGIQQFPEAGIAWNLWYGLFLDALKHCRIADSQKVSLLLDYIGSTEYKKIQDSLETRKRKKTLEDLNLDEICKEYEKILKNESKIRKKAEMEYFVFGSMSEKSIEMENQNGHLKTEQPSNESTECNLDCENSKATTQSNVKRIWKGIVSWFSKSNKSKQKQISFHVTAKYNDEDPIINAIQWPENLNMWIIAKHRLKESDFLESKSVDFHPSPCETMGELKKLMSSGYFGLVRLSQSKECDVKLLILCYKDEETFGGYIPKNQIGFIERLKKDFKSNSDKKLKSEEPNTTEEYDVEPRRKKPKLSPQIQTQEAHCSYTVESENNKMDASTSSNNSDSDNESTATMDNCPDKIYSLGYEYIGHVIIINNRQFQESKNKKRNGSEIDVKELSNVFSNLGFNVAKPLINKPHAKITKHLNDLRKNETFLKEISSLFIILMSHGNKNDKVMAFDIEMDIYKDIVNQFSSEQCPVLAGKPKFFIIQACRGKDMDYKKKKSDVKAHSGHTLDYIPILPLEKIPNFTDILIATSAYKNHASYLHPETGSVYIQELCEILKSTDLYKEHLVDILTTLNAQIAQKQITVTVEEKGKRKEIDRVRLTSTFHSTLTKKFYFKASCSEEDLDDLNNMTKNL